MESETNTPMAAVTEKNEDTDSFTKVTSKRNRKRQRDMSDMDTEGAGASKRPQFPPISSDKLRVSSSYDHTVCFHLS